MSFRWEGGRKLTDLFDPGPLEAAARRMALQVQSKMLELVAELTPVGAPPQGVDLDEWVKARGDRAPGTLKESWERGEIEILTVGNLRVSVLTHDPVAPYVENFTRPHVIRPRTPRVRDEDGTVHGGILRFWNASTGQIAFAGEVHHPGTEGAHMMAKTLQEAAVRWPEWVQDELVRWTREQAA